MKLSELFNPKPGTYVGLRVLDPANKQIKERFKASGIEMKKSSQERRLHTTVLYSKKHCANLISEPNTVHEASVISYSLFNNSSGVPSTLVLRLNAPSIVARHLELMERYSAAHDFPTYEPHITIAHDFNGSIANLPLISFPIFLGEEYVEELWE